MMKAIAFSRHLPIDDPQSLEDVMLPKPSPMGRDLLVSIKAVSVNPVDVKVRRGKTPGQAAENAPRVIGFDASGVVEAVGAEVTLFKPGDPVFYAGDLSRPGSNAEFQLVDERIVGPKPHTLSHAEAAALPLTAITAYECFFDRLSIARDGEARGQSLLIIGGAGGVGSIGIQIAKLAGLTVIATASRPESIAWVKRMGADHVVSHRDDMVAQVRALGFRHVDHIAIFNDMRHWPAAVELIRPQGGIVSIDNTDVPLPMAEMKLKSASLHWEFMFTRPMQKTPDMQKQHALLAWVAAQVDQGRLRSTLARTLSPLNAGVLREAHRLVETGAMMGKVVVAAD